MGKIKIGCCVDLRSEEQILARKDAGADYIEGALTTLTQMPQREIAALSHLLRDNSLPLTSFNCMFPSSVRLTGDWVDYSKIDSYLCDAVEKASLFCPETMVFGCGVARSIPDGFREDHGKNQLAFLLRTHIAPLLEQYHIVCAVEPLCRKETNVLKTLPEMAELVQTIGNEQICLMADYYHLLQSGESADALVGLRIMPVHFHLASYNRKLPMPGDGTDYATLFRTLHAIGYTGSISLECEIDRPFESNIAASLAFLRQYL